MRRIVLLLALLVLTTWLVRPGPAWSSAAPARVLACGDYDWQVTGSGLSQGAGATWDDSCGATEQVRAQCHNFITGTTYFAYSGEVRSNGILDWAGCGFSDSVLAGQIQATDCDCGLWHTFWTGGRRPG